MSNAKFGMSDWDQELSNGKGNRQAGAGGKKDVYMRLQEGSNPVRILTRPFQYLSHKYKAEGDTGFGDKVMCSAPLHKACPLCDLKDRPKKRWFISVIDRKTNERKLLDISVAVYGQIKELNQSEDWGNPIHYDVDIKVNKNAPPANYYSVLPKPKKPLTDSDLVHKQEVNEEDIASKCSPPTPEFVVSRVNAIRSKKGLPALSFEAPAAPAAPVQVDDSASAEDEDFHFPVASA